MDRLMERGSGNSAWANVYYLFLVIVERCVYWGGDSLVLYTLRYALSKLLSVNSCTNTPLSAILGPSPYSDQGTD